MPINAHHASSASSSVWALCVFLCMEATAIELAPSWDARAATRALCGAWTPLDQGATCASCCAMALASALSARACLRDARDTVFSARQIWDCAGAMGIATCDEGAYLRALINAVAARQGALLTLPPTRPTITEEEELPQRIAADPNASSCLARYMQAVVDSADQGGGALPSSYYFYHLEEGLFMDAVHFLPPTASSTSPRGRLLSRDGATTVRKEDRTLPPPHRRIRPQPNAAANDDRPRSHPPPPHHHHPYRPRRALLLLDESENADAVDAASSHHALAIDPSTLAMMAEIQLHGPVVSVLTLNGDVEARRFIELGPGDQVFVPAEEEAAAGGEAEGETTTTIWRHCIMVYGWGTTPDGQPFWRVQNSYGPHWGDNGTARIVRGALEAEWRGISTAPHPCTPPGCLHIVVPEADDLAARNKKNKNKNNDTDTNHTNRSNNELLVVTALLGVVLAIAAVGTTILVLLLVRWHRHATHNNNNNNNTNFNANADETNHHDANAMFYSGSASGLIRGSRWLIGGGGGSQSSSSYYYNHRKRLADAA